MRRMGKVAGFKLLSLFEAVSLFAADRLAIHLRFTTAKQDCPLQISGFKLPKPSDGRPMAPEVLLHNTTEKTIEFFYLYGLVGDPRGNVDAEPQLVDALGQESPSVQPPPQIAPYGDVAFEATFLRPMNSASDATRLGRSCLSVAVVVTQVRFSNAETWKADVKDFQALWTGSIQPETVQQCSESENAGDALKELKSFTISPRVAAEMSSSPVKSYSVACALQSVSGEERAICDW